MSLATTSSTVTDSVAQRRIGLKSVWLELLLALSILLLAVQLTWPALRNWQNRPRPGTQVGQHSETYDYLIYLPEQYSRENRRWPLLIFLHGSGERGADLSTLTVCGPPKLISEGRHHPMIVVSPQCPADANWQSGALTSFLDHLCTRFRVDPDRVYVSGYSMGGAGTWNFAAADSDRLAAIAPLCGGGEPSQASQLAGLPIWAFHGEQDDVVTIDATLQMIDAVKKAGGDPKVTVYPDLDHGICDHTYRQPELYSWLLSQRRRRHATEATTGNHTH